MTLSEALETHLRSIHKKQIQHKHSKRPNPSYEVKEVRELLMKKVQASSRRLPQGSVDSLGSALLRVGEDVIPGCLNQLIDEVMGTNSESGKTAHPKSETHARHPATLGYFMCRESEVDDFIKIQPILNRYWQ